jgi:hypothetical protein
MRRLLMSRGVTKKRIVAALPLKAKGFTVKEVTAFAQYFGEDVERYHLLGMSPLSRSFNKVLAEIRKESPKAKITCDATTIITGARGEAWELGINPRVYTYAQDIVRFDIMLEAFQKSYRGFGTMEGWEPGVGWKQVDLPDWTDHVVGEVDGWLPKRLRIVLADKLMERCRKARKGGWSCPTFGRKEHALLVRSPDDFLASYMYPEDPSTQTKWWSDPEVDWWINDQWVRFLGSYFPARVKRDAIAKAWVATTDSAINALMFNSSA